MTNVLNALYDIIFLIENDSDNAININLLNELEKRLSLFKKNTLKKNGLTSLSLDRDGCSIIEESKEVDLCSYVKQKPGRKLQYTDAERKALGNERTKLSYIKKKEEDPLFLQKLSLHRRAYKAKSNGDEYNEDDLYSEVKLKPGRKKKNSETEPKSLNNEKTKLLDEDPLFSQKQSDYIRVYKEKSNSEVKLKLKCGRKLKYTDAERKALNNEQTKLLYYKKKEEDPLFSQKQRDYSRAAYYRLKQANIVKNDA